MSSDGFDGQLKKISIDQHSKFENTMLPKALNFEKMPVPKLIFPEFDERGRKVDSNSSHSESMSPDSSNINDVDIEKNEDIYKNATSSNKVQQENLTNRMSQNDNWDETAPIAQQIIIKYSGLNDIAGLNMVKQSLKEAIIYPTKYPQLFTNGRTVWSRALLYGVPGVGKTALVHAIAAEASLPLYQISSADITSAWFGQSEKLIRKLFKTLGHQRCLLLIDEVDAICRKSQLTDSSHFRRAATEMLIQIQNFEDSPMFLICTTNCPWEIDAAFLRRFQQRIYIPLPDFDARKQIILSNVHETGNITRNSQLNDFVRATEGLTGSDLINMTRHALMIPLREMEAATYWKETECGYMIPCNKSHVNAVKCKLENIPNTKVFCRSVEMNDLWHALKNTDTTVTKEDLIPFQQFKENRKMKL